MDNKRSVERKEPEKSDWIAIGVVAVVAILLLRFAIGSLF